MRALAIFLLAASCMGQGFTHNNPGFMVFRGATNPCDMSLDVSNMQYLAAWYVADNAITNSSGQVTNLPDFGRVGWNLTNRSSTAPMISNAWINGHAAIKFDGTDDFIAREAISGPGNTIEVAWVGWPETGQVGIPYNLVTNWYMEPVISSSVYSIAYNGAWSGEGFTFATTNFSVFNDVYNHGSTNLAAYYNNALSESADGVAFTNTTMNSVYLGCEFPEYGHCKFLMAEMAIFTNQMSAANRTNLYNYWCCKYGLAPVTNNTVEFDPRSVGSLQYWFGADGKKWKDTDMSQRVTTDGDVVKVWEDQSGNGRHISSSTAPFYKASQINGKPSIQFAGGNTNLSRTGDPTFWADTTMSNIIFTVQYIRTFYPGSQQYSMLCSSAHNGTAPTRQITGIDNLDSKPSFKMWSSDVFWHVQNLGSPDTSGPISNYCILRSTFAGQSSTIFTNMVFGATNSSLNSSIASTNTGLIVGNAVGGGAGFCGNIAELLFYNGTLTSNETYLIESYLTNRYSIHP